MQRLCLVLLFFAGGAKAERIADPAVCEARAANDPEVKKGYLFSAVSLAGSSVARAWASLLPTAKSRFPGLKLKEPGDLHIRVLTVGADYKFNQLGTLGSWMRVTIPTSVELTPQVIRTGKKREMVSLELSGIPVLWTTHILQSKARLKEIGLKKDEPSFDSSFKANVVLGEVKVYRSASDGSGGQDSLRDLKPSEDQELEDFQGWVATQVDWARQRLQLNEGTQVELMLAGAWPRGPSAYILVEDFMSLLAGPSAKNSAP